MIKEIIVAGIKLNNYTAIENLFHMHEYMEKNRFVTVQEIYMKTLLLAQEDEVVKTAIENIDISVIAETDILEAAGENTMLRKREIEKREFFHRLMKIIERNGYSVLVLGETTKKVEETMQQIKEEYPRVQFIGFESLEECVGAEEKMINNINLESPDIILSILPSPMQEHFLMEHKSMLLTKLWYGMDDKPLSGEKHGLRDALVKMFRRKKLFNYEEKVELEEDKENESI